VDAPHQQSAQGVQGRPGRKLSVVAGTQRRHQEGYLEAMKRVHGGDIAKSRPPAATGTRQAVATPTARRVRPTWSGRFATGFISLGCRAITSVNSNVHNLDVINWAMQDHPKWAQAWRPAGAHRPEFGHIFDHFAIEYEYPTASTWRASAARSKGAR